MYLFQNTYQRKGIRPAVLGAETLFASVIGIASAVLLFPAHASLVSVFLIVAAQSDTVVRLLDQNRVDIWFKKEPSLRANARLAVALMVIFLTIFLVFAAAACLLSIEDLAVFFDEQLGKYAGRTEQGLSFPPFLPLFGHNLLVLLASILFAFIFRHAGMLIVLTWNASIWGTVLPFLVRASSPGDFLSTAAGIPTVALAVLPHLLLEATSYILAAMAGTFVSLAVLKYDVVSREFKQVMKAVLQILAVSLILLAAAAFLESVLPATLLRW